MNDKGGCKTAPATPGLLITFTCLNYCCLQNSVTALSEAAVLLLAELSVLLAKVARMEALHGFPQSKVFPNLPLIAAGKYRTVTKYGGEIGWCCSKS